MGSYARLPVEFVRGEGARLWDDEGNEYLDFLCGISVTNLGHCHPRVVEAVREQVGRLMHTSNLFYTEPAMRLADAPVGLRAWAARCSSATPAPRPTRRRSSSHARPAPAGTWWSSTAPSTGAPTARCRRPRRSPSRLRSRPWFPASARSRAEPAALRAAVDERTAAVLLEPIQGETGVHVLSDELLVAAREACDEHGAALVFDEVQSGMGRTGTLWAYEQTGVLPDAITVAKALGGGLPIGALITGERLADVFVPGDHGSTFAGGPVVAAAALAALEVTDDPAAARARASSSATPRGGLQRLPHVTSVRGRGLMLACELDVPAPAIVRRALLEQRLIVNATGPTPCGCLPPLTIGPDEVEQALRAAGRRAARLGRPSSRARRYALKCAGAPADQATVSCSARRDPRMRRRCRVRPAVRHLGPKFIPRRRLAPAVDRRACVPVRSSFSRRRPPLHRCPTAAGPLDHQRSGSLDRAVSRGRSS